MKTVLAFDVYGTLIDTAGVVSRLRDLLGAPAEDFSRAWREKQLEYSFRRGLMRKYASFGVCTRDALEHTCARFDVTLTDENKDALLAEYRVLPAFADVTSSLDGLRAAGLDLYAFSNGTADAVDALLTNAGIRDRFVEIVSVDDLGTFKPSPDVYHYFLARSGAAGEQAWLVSGNPFDVIGAISAGMRAAWVRRSADTPFDPWGIEPTIVIAGLDELGEGIARHASGG